MERGRREREEKEKWGREGQPEKRKVNVEKGNAKREERGVEKE